MLKPAMYMIVMSAIRMDTPWKVLYDRLVPLKCPYDERLQKYRGKLKVIGRIPSLRTRKAFSRDSMSVMRRMVTSVRWLRNRITNSSPPQRNASSSWRMEDCSRTI